MAIDQRSAHDEAKRVACRVLLEVLPSGDAAIAEDAVTADYVDHESPAEAGTGPGAVISLMRMLHASFSDQVWTLDNVIAEGDVVAIRSTHTGRHTGTFFGIPATGRAFSFSQMHFVRVADGRAAEHWGVRDDASLMRQLTGPAAS